MARTIRLSNIEWLNFKSKSSMDYPLLINTAGCCDISFLFETYNPIGRDDYYLIYVIDGQLTVNISDNVYIAKKGSTILFPPKYKYKYRGASPINYLFAHFTGSYAENFLKECGFCGLPCIIENDFSTEIQSKFNLMIDTFLRNNQLSIQKCACLLQEILINIGEKSADRTDSSTLKNSLRHIHESFTDKINIPYLASLESLSNSRYITVFKKQMGKSPNEYIIELRLQLAKNMLDSSNMSIKQISQRVGYNDQYFFSRLFKKHIGISPHGYRDKNKLV